jgi:heptosyltransferase-1
MSASPRILIIRLSSLGDILHALPAFAALREAHPNAQIDWLAADKCKFLLSAIRGIDSVRVLDARALLRFPLNRNAWSQLRLLIRDLRRQHYDFSLDFQGLLKTAILGILCGARTRMGFSRELIREFPAHWFYHRKLAKPKGQVHVLELNRMLAAMAGAVSTVAALDFVLPNNDEHLVESLLKKEQLTDFVTINPGGGWPTKRWSLERYGELAKRIKMELGLSVAVTTGPGEESYFRTIAEHCEGYVPSHFPVSFLQLIPLLKRARLVIGGDTGPFHLACALGKSVVGIFGPTSPQRNGPWRCEDEAVVHPLPCSYCYGRSCTTNNECMDISVDEVFDAVVRRLANDGGSINADR